MAGKFLELAEAARKLGVSPEQLIEMRSRGEIFGVRKGSSWEFKQDEIDRVLAERADNAGDDLLSSDPGSFDAMLAGLSGIEDDADSILITDDAPPPGGSHLGSAKSSTIIGQDNVNAPAGSDIMMGPAKGSGHSDALAFAPDNFSSSGSGIVRGSQTDLMGNRVPAPPSSESVDSLADLDSVDGIANSDDELMLADDLDLADSGSSIMSDEMELAVDDLSLSADELGLADEEESVLGSEGSGKQARSGIGSDITGGKGDSGINLLPSDAGLSLDEEPLDLGGSQVESLELGLDDGMLSLEEAADPDQATQLKADDQFMLSPTDAPIEDDTDSGSQVIALEDSDSFEGDTDTVLRPGGQALIEDDAFGGGGLGMGMAGMGMAGMGMAGAGMMAGAAASPGMMPQYGPAPLETPYSIWQVLTLLILTGILTLSGMLMVDVVNNMWSWTGSTSASTFVMDAVINSVGLNK